MISLFVRERNVSRNFEREVAPHLGRISLSKNAAEFMNPREHRRPLITMAVKHR